MSTTTIAERIATADAIRLLQDAIEVVAPNGSVSTPAETDALGVLTAAAIRLDNSTPGADAWLRQEALRGNPLAEAWRMAPRIARIAGGRA